MTNWSASSANFNTTSIFSFQFASEDRLRPFARALPAGEPHGIELHCRLRFEQPCFINTHRRLCGIPRIENMRRNWGQKMSNNAPQRPLKLRFFFTSHWISSPWSSALLPQLSQRFHAVWRIVVTKGPGRRRKKNRAVENRLRSRHYNFTLPIDSTSICIIYWFTSLLSLVDGMGPALFFSWSFVALIRTTNTSTWCELHPLTVHIAPNAPCWVDPGNAARLTHCTCHA